MMFLKDKTNKKLLTAYSGIAALMIFCAFVIHKLTTAGNIIWTIGYFVSVSCISLLMGVILGVASTLLVSKLSEPRNAGTKIDSTVTVSGFKVWFGTFGLLLLAWLPLFLAYYPGVCAYDSYVQLEQIVNGAYNEHHPLIHTKLIELCLESGRLIWDNSNAGIAVYVVLQSILLAAAMAYSMSVAYGILSKQKLTKKRLVVILGVMQFYYMFSPFNGYMAISVTKDTIFAAFMLLQLTALLDCLWNEKSNLGGKYLLFVIGSIGSILFRNNGKYATLVLIAGLCIAWVYSIKTKLSPALFSKLFAGALGSLLVSVILLNNISSSLNAVQGDKREMLSIPIQQLARSMIYHGGAGVLAEDDNTISDKDKLLINEFLLNESYKLYRQDISDPVKRHTNTYVVRYRSREFIETYVGLFLDYPGEYINAFLAVNAGFLDITDTSHAKVNLSKTEDGLGYIQTRWEESAFGEQGIYKDSKIPWLFEKLEIWVSENGYLSIPILNYLLRPGLYLWICIGIAVTFIVLKSYRFLLPMCYIAGYYLTMFFGPTVQMRYVFPVMIVVPCLMCLCGTLFKRKAKE